MVRDGPAHDARSTPGGRRELKFRTSRVASFPASSPICRFLPIIVPSADDIPQPIAAPLLMPPAVMTVKSKPYSDRHSFMHESSIPVV